MSTVASITETQSEMKQFSDRFFNKKLSYPAAEIDAVVGFFTSREFDKTAAISVATILLEQAKTDDIKVFQLIDSLKGLDSIQLSTVVTEVLNLNRPKSSVLGFRVENKTEWNEARNIMV